MAAIGKAIPIYLAFRRGNNKQYQRRTRQLYFTWTIYYAFTHHLVSFTNWDSFSLFSNCSNGKLSVHRNYSKYNENKKKSYVVLIQFTCAGNNHRHEMYRDFGHFVQWLLLTPVNRSERKDGVHFTKLVGIYIWFVYSNLLVDDIGSCFNNLPCRKGTSKS